MTARPSFGASWNFAKSSKRKFMSIHQNSLKAFTESQDQLNRREKEILGALHMGARMTDRQIMTALGYNEPNAVRPRITNLIDDLWVEQCGDQKDALTQKTVRIVRALAVWERAARIRRAQEAAMQPQLNLFQV